MKKAWLYTRIILATLILTLFLFRDNVSIIWVKIYAKRQSFKGTIIDMYVKPNSRSARFIVVDNITYSIAYSIYDSLLLGDYILKEKGFVNYTVYRKGKELVFYPSISGYKIYNDSVVKIN